MSYTSGIEQLNSHTYLYLDSLWEEVDLELCILVDEAKVRGNTSEGSAQASLYGAIVSDSTCQKYKITFKSYVAYSVRNESFTISDDEETFAGNLFREYSVSKFLDYVVSSTVAVEEIVGAYKHYQLVCSNHIIDVATAYEPSIEIIGTFGDSAP